MKEPITLAESKDLIALESLVEVGRKSWVTAGKALMEIRDRNLFRADHDDFWSYCEARWGWKRRNALYIIESCEVYDKLPEGVQNFAQSASQARALANVRPEHRAEVLERAAKKGKVTAKTIEEAAEEIESPLPAQGSTPQESKEDRGGQGNSPRPTDGQWLSAMGKTTAEPRVTEYYERLHALVADALENASDKQLRSMSVRAATICKEIKDVLREREMNRKATP